MTRDPIVEEVRAARDAIAKECEYDLAAIFLALQKQEKQSGREHVTLKARKPITAATEEAAQQDSIAAGGVSRS